jgi:cytochrome P450
MNIPNDTIYKIPTLDHRMPFRILESVKNMADMMSEGFHETLIRTWEELNCPKMFAVYFPLKGFTDLVPIIFVADPTLAERAIRDTGKIRHDVSEVPELGDFDKSIFTRSIGGDFGPAGYYSLFTISNTEEYRGLVYKQIQETILPAFSSKALKQYSVTMVEDALELVKSLPIEGEVELVSLIDHMVLNSATRALMSFKFTDAKQMARVEAFLRDGPKAAIMKGLLSDGLFNLTQVIRKRIPSNLIPDAEAYLEERQWLFDKIVGVIFKEKRDKIAEAGENYIPEDMLDFLIISLLEAQKKESDEIYQKIQDDIAAGIPIQESIKKYEGVFSDQKIEEVVKDSIATFLIVGQETSASQQVSAWAYLLDPKNIEVLGKLKEEIDTVLKGKLPTYEDMKKLPYLEAVMRYVSALYPNAHIIPRETTKEIEFGDEKLPKGTQVFPSPLLVHRNVIPNLEELTPETFMGEEGKKLFHKLITFGVGLRACIGERFSGVEFMMQIATILTYCDLELIEMGNSQSGVVPLRAANSINVKVKKKNING